MNRLVAHYDFDIEKIFDDEFQFRLRFMQKLDTRVQADANNKQCHKWNESVELCFFSFGWKKGLRIHPIYQIQKKVKGIETKAKMWLIKRR